MMSLLVLFGLITFKPVRAFIVSQIKTETFPITGSRECKLEDSVTLYVVVKIKDAQGNVKYLNPFIDSAWILRKKVKIEKPTKEWRVMWYAVEPVYESYTNDVTPEGIKYARITYRERKIKEGWKLENFQKPGTYRFCVKVKYKRAILKTPGKKAVSKMGIRENVFRLSIRKDDTFTGWATMFLGVPYIDRSASIHNEEPAEKHQCERCIGCDYADFVLAVYRRYLKFKGKDVDKITYTNATGLLKYGEIIHAMGEITMDNAGNYFVNGKKLLFGRDVKEGDIILYGYDPSVEGSIAWHVAILVEDRSNPKSVYRGGKDGIFNKWDLVIQTFFSSPKYVPIGDFGRFSVMRFRNLQ